jgi:YidC/Oxa1 family membrane protein insertase
MNDIRKTMLWAVLGISLFMIFDNWRVANGRPSMLAAQPRPAAPAASASSAPQSAASLAAQTAASTAAALPKPMADKSGADALPGAAPNTASTAPSSTEPAKPSERVVVSNDLMKATFDSRGGELIRIEFLKHDAGYGQKGGVVLLSNSNPTQRVYTARSGLVNKDSNGAFLPSHLSNFSFKPGVREIGSAESVTLEMESEELGGAKLTKSYTFKRGSYAIDVKHQVQNNGTQALTPNVYMILHRDGNKVASGAPAIVEQFGVQTFTGPALYSEKNKFEKIEFADIEKGKANYSTQVTAGWVAMVQHYFVSAWIPPKEASFQVQAYKEPGVVNLYNIAMTLPMPQIAAGGRAEQSARLFIGPQEERNLESIAPGLDLVKDYGWFTIFAKPLFYLLELIHRFVQNWGFAIIGLTLLVKLVFYPLQSAAYKSMAKMKAVTPRMTEIRERLKDKPQEMNRAMMELYRTEKVNPLGGCLPILIQFPIFIALYWVLLSSVEMRGAPWLGWITDLSIGDPLYILPVLLTLSTFLQIKLNPTPADPLQAKLMWILPGLFSIMFFFFPAGLVLYWLTNNVLSIAQQWIINKRMNVA